MLVLIFKNEPSDWKDLQNKVCDILRVCGCKATVEESISTVRGSVNIDVYAVDQEKRPPLIYMCECKHWSTSVPKTVVHSFRTVVSDHGGHVGFIISKSGFQSGAYEASLKSNIHLLTWNEFQTLFLDRWKDARYNELQPKFEELFEFFDYFSAPIGNAIGGSESRLKEFESLIRRYSPQAAGNPWNRMINKGAFPPALPHLAIKINEDGTKSQILFEDYFSLMEWHETQTLEGLREFNAFVAKYRTGPVGS